MMAHFLNIFFCNDIPWLHALYVTVIEKRHDNNIPMFMQVICGKRLCTVIAVIVHKFLIRLALLRTFSRTSCLLIRLLLVLRLWNEKERKNVHTMM